MLQSGCQNVPGNPLLQFQAQGRSQFWMTRTRRQGERLKNQGFSDARTLNSTSVLERRSRRPERKVRCGPYLVR